MCSRFETISLIRGQSKANDGILDSITALFQKTPACAAALNAQFVQEVLANDTDWVFLGFSFSNELMSTALVEVRSDSEWHIHMLCSRGCGQQTLARIHEFARQHEVTLMTLDSLWTAVTFYREQGYTFGDGSPPEAKSVTDFYETEGLSTNFALGLKRAELLDMRGGCLTGLWERPATGCKEVNLEHAAVMMAFSLQEPVEIVRARQLHNRQQRNALKPSGSRSVPMYMSMSMYRTGFKNASRLAGLIHEVFVFPRPYLSLFPLEPDALMAFCTGADNLVLINELENVLLLTRVLPDQWSLDAWCVEDAEIFSSLVQLAQQSCIKYVSVPRATFAQLGFFRRCRFHFMDPENFKRNAHVNEIFDQTYFTSSRIFFDLFVDGFIPFLDIENFEAETVEPNREPLPESTLSRLEAEVEVLSAEKSRQRRQRASQLR